METTDANLDDILTPEEADSSASGHNTDWCAAADLRPSRVTVRLNEVTVSPRRPPRLVAGVCTTPLGCAVARGRPCLALVRVTETLCCGCCRGGVCGTGWGAWGEDPVAGLLGKMEGDT